MSVETATGAPHRYPPIQQLLPQQGYMCLLDQVIAIEPDSLTASVQLTAQSSFAESGEVGSWVGLEYMAQAIAALVSWESLQRQQAPKPGLLLGTRRYQSQCASFALDTQLQVRVQRAFQSDGLAAFECCISQQQQELASATLTVYQPEDFGAFLQRGEPA